MRFFFLMFTGILFFMFSVAAVEIQLSNVLIFFTVFIAAVLGFLFSLFGRAK